MLWKLIHVYSLSEYRPNNIEKDQIRIYSVVENYVPPQKFQFTLNPMMIKGNNNRLDLLK